MSGLSGATGSPGLAPGEAVARFASDAERADWDTLVAANPGGGEVWMGDAYLDLKRREGRYRDLRVVVERAGRAPVVVGVLAKRVPLLGEWWHLPAGPAGATVEDVLDTAAAVAELARSRGAFMVKIEPRLDPAARDAIHAAGYRDTVRIIPNPSTVIVDLGDPGRTDDELLASLGKKARNSINRARRDGIEATRVPATDENCAALYRLLQETAEGRFVLRSERYYREFWQSFERSGSGQMFLAHRAGDDGEPVLIAGAYAMILGEKTTYKDGASVRAKTAYGASHALQWEVIRWAHERGAVAHDLCGAPPADRADDKTHPLHGVGQFKRSFSPEITDYAGAFDLPLKPRAYRLWVKIGDRIARRASLALKKDPYY
ncbi:lipid II:glycine glycyltransferase FemX [Leucobacter tenebrionis]|uniref:lipid II:glycine glycyltransferase FemX n=1 Tax=Leucobacter tenebrionis TaxID=2873270 RepID=UPI001CA5F53F|nr:peptidoglycan bridge formation glycyltransferase FemA/FemB family protein [Leucobacter tenebrionis]QZY52603.1 peptidoglycan bridge formation glycyltransferase FemA/FemB family protein [Leucobacter tenebrionis]